MGHACNCKDSRVLLLLCLPVYLQIGCTVAYSPCPALAPFFSVPTNGTLLATSDSASSYCIRDQPTSCPSVVVTTGTASITTSIPVRNSNVAGDNSASIIGCIAPPATGGTGTADLGSSNGCPASVPSLTAGSFDFFVAAGLAVTASGSTTAGVTAGNVIECRKRDAGRSCGSLLPLRAYSETTPAGCVALSGSLPACIGAGYVTNYAFELYGPTIASGTNADATARLEACITNPQPSTNAADRSCALVVPALTYTIPVSSDPLNADLTGSNLLGCAKAGNTACPATSVSNTYYPIISNTTQIQACRSQSACTSGYIPLCDSTTTGKKLPTTGICDGSNTLGCLVPLANNINQCSTLTSNSKYPTTLANPFKFVVGLANPSLFSFQSCTNFAALTDCNGATGSAYVIKATPAGECSASTGGILHHH